MIYALTVIDKHIRDEPVVKIPPAPLFRKMLICHSTQEAKDQIATAWDESGKIAKKIDCYMQLDIIEWRKPTGFSAAAKAGELGYEVFVTRRIRKVEKP